MEPLPVSIYRPEREEAGQPVMGAKKRSGMCSNRVRRTAGVLIICAAWVLSASAQELSPRTFWPAPVGTRVVVAGYQFAEGDVLMDPSVPLYGVDSKIHSGILGYLQTFGLWGRSSNVLLEVPYSVGTTQGLVVETPAKRDFAGFNDPGITLTVNLVGAPAMSASEFQNLRDHPRPIVGMSLKLVPPLGHYEDGRLINVGANRWAARLKLGSVLPLHPKWLLEAEASVWFFGDDNDYLTGKREQGPIYALETHLVRRFKPGFWASLDANYFAGGRQTIGGDELDDLQSNRRLGATLVMPFAGRNAIKFGFSAGTRTRYGNDFRQFIVSYQRVLR
jgi:hypothetical protein